MILDTEFLISLRAEEDAALELAAALEAAGVPTRVPTIVVEELYAGVGAGVMPAENARAYDALVANEPVVPLDDRIARPAGTLEGEHLATDSKPDLGPADAIVAATGPVLEEAVVTNDGDSSTSTASPSNRTDAPTVRVPVRIRSRALRGRVTETEFLFDQVTSAFEASTTFAFSVPRFSDQDLATFEEFEEFNETDLHWEDPIPDCDHLWKEFDDIEYCARCRINRTYSTERTRFLYDNMGFLGPLERPDVPKVPDPPEPNRTQSQDEEEPVEQVGGYDSWNPHGVPDCDHFMGPEHEWVDYGWADQGKAKCSNCNEKIEKRRLGPDEVKDDFSGWRPSSTDIPECDDSDGHEWIKTEILNRGRVQCRKCHISTNRDRLPDSAEVDDLWE